MNLSLGEGFLFLIIALLLCASWLAEAWIHEFGATTRVEMQIDADRESRGLMMQWQNTRDKMSAQPFILPLPSFDEPPQSRFPSA